MRIARFIPLLLLLLLCIRPALAAPLNPAAVPEDAQWVLHLDMDALRASPEWATLKEKFTGARRADFDQRIQGIERLTGLRLAQDLHDITLYGSAFGDQKTVLLLHADLNSTRIMRFMRLNPDYSSTPYQGHEIISWREKARDRIMYGAFATPALAVVAPTKELVQSALDSLDAKARSKSPLLADLPPKAIFFLAGKDLAGLGAKFALLKQIDVASLAATETNGNISLTLTVTTNVPGTADRLNTFIDNLKATTALDMSQPTPSARSRILDALFTDFTANVVDNKLTLTSTLTPKSLESLLLSLRTAPTPETAPAK